MTDQIGSPAKALAARAIDPVCGMIVDPAHADQYVESDRTIYFCCSGCLALYSADPAKYGAVSSSAARAVDPVCGMEVDPAHADRYDDGNGVKYFCCAGCRAKYAAAPATYAAARAAVEHDRCCCARAVQRTPAPCTRRFGRRARQLSNLRHGARAGHNERRRSAERRTRGYAAPAARRSVAAVPVILLAMGGHIASLGLDRIIPSNVAAWLQFAFATPVVAWAGWPFFERAWRSVVHRSLNMFTLIALGMGAACICTAPRRRLLPGIFPSGFSRHPTVRYPCISRQRPSSPSWSSWVKFSNCARANKPAARSAHC